MDKNVEATSEATRAKLDQMSRALLRLHKALLDDERTIYEAEHGRVTSTPAMFQIVLNHPSFIWLGKFSSLIVLMDEAASVRRPAPEATSQGLLAEVRSLLNLEAGEKTFVEQFQKAIRRSLEVKDIYEEAFKIATE